MVNELEKRVQDTYGTVTEQIRLSEQDSNTSSDRIDRAINLLLSFYNSIIKVQEKEINSLMENENTKHYYNSFRKDFYKILRIRI